MSFESVGVQRPVQESQPLLSAGLNRRLRGLVARLTGITGLAATAALAVSLLTWSVADPSLTHATGGATKNLLGPLGAIISDLMMQMLGMAGVFALLPPAFWALQLLTREEVPGLKAKIILLPCAVLAIAAALSAVPTLAAWPLRHGFGGILGDLGLSLLANVLGIINADRAAAAAGLFYCAAGMALLMAALGLSQSDLMTVLFGTRAERAARADVASGGWRSVFKRGRGTNPARDHRDDPFAAAPLTSNGPLMPIPPMQQMPLRQPQPQSYQGMGHLPMPMQHPHHPSHVAMPLPMPMPHPQAWQPAPQPSYQPMMPQNHISYPVPYQPASAPLVQQGLPRPQVAPERREPSFDTITDEASLTMARRFAPHGSASAAVLDDETSSPSREPAEPLATRAGSLMTGMIGSFKRAPREAVYHAPSLNLLRRSTPSKAGVEQMQTAQRGIARMLTDVLADFGIKGEIRDIRPGPVVTLYEFEPARGTKTARVIGLADDIARNMSASAVRVAVVPGRNTIGIELPNVKRETVYLRDLVEADGFRAMDARLPVALGKTIGGDPIVADLARMPHLLVAGTTGSGKSVGVNAMILSLLYRLTPDECRFIMIDPKMLELSVYNGIPHLLTPVVTDPQKAVAALNWVVGEMEERYKRMAKLNVRNIDAYNTRVKNAGKRGEPLSRTVQTGFDAKTGQAVYEREDLDAAPMPYIVVIADEFADLMAVAGKEIEFAVQRLAQMARAAGIHLIMATQRPSVDIITGTIKANFPTRMSFRVASKIDSRTIINETGAEQLLGQGDMLFAGGAGPIMRLHGPFVSDEEVEAIAGHLRAQGEPRYVSGITDIAEDAKPTPETDAAVSEDDLYDRAVAIIVRDQKASTSYLQRRLSIGYNRAADLIERMERDGLIGPPNHAGKRPILMTSPTPPSEA